MGALASLFSAGEAQSVKPLGHSVSESGLEGRTWLVEGAVQAQFQAAAGCAMCTRPRFGPRSKLCRTTRPAAPSATLCTAAPCTAPQRAQHSTHQEA